MGRARPTSRLRPTKRTSTAGGRVGGTGSAKTRGLHLLSRYLKAAVVSLVAAVVSLVAAVVSLVAAASLQNQAQR